MFESITIVGHLGRDVELRKTTTGKDVATMSVATNRKFTNGDGAQVKETTWHRITIWGEQALNAAKYLQKGSLVLVEGRLQPDPRTGGPRIYNRQDGTVGANYDIVANNVRYLSSAKPVGEEVADLEEIPI